MQSNQFMINIAVELDVVKTEHGPHLLQDSGLVSYSWHCQFIIIIDIVMDAVLKLF